MKHSTKVQKREQLKGTYCTINFIDFSKFNVSEHGPELALLFQKLAYECYNSVLLRQSPDGFYYYAQARARTDFGIGERRFETVINTLQKMGVLIVDRNRGVRQMGNGRTLKVHHYKICFDQLANVDILSKLYNVSFVELQRIARQYELYAQTLNNLITPKVFSKVEEDRIELPF